MSKVFCLVLLIALALGLGTAQAAPPPRLDAGTVQATRYSLVDAGKAEHASLSMTTYTREVVLYGSDANGVEIAAQDGSQIDVSAASHAIRMGAPGGVALWRGPLTVADTVNADNGYLYQGAPGLTIQIPLPPDGWLTVKGGIVVDYRAPSTARP